MGQAVSVQCRAADLTFFQLLDVDIARDFIRQWNSLDSNSPILSWSDYFKCLLEAQKSLEIHSLEVSRKSWNPVCMSYAMTRLETSQLLTSAMKQESTLQHSSVPEDHTDDDASATSDASDPSIHQDATTERSIPSELSQVHTVHPVFFGYSTETYQEQSRRRQQDAEAEQNQEQRAMERAIAARRSSLNQMEEQFFQQKKSREKKIEAVRAQYDKEDAKRAADYQKSIEGLDLTIAESIKAQHEIAVNSHLLAFEREFQELTNKNELKSAQDVRLVSVKREELNALLDATQFHKPIESRLEDFSKAEILRCASDLADRMKVSQNLSAELCTLKAELDSLNAMNDPKVLKSKQYQELRSMVNVAETRLKESLKSVLSSKVNLSDAESLLVHAIRLKKQESAVLPLFKMLCAFETRMGAVDEGCRRMLLFISLLLLSRGSFEKKANHILDVFNSNRSGLFDFEFVVSVGRWVLFALQALGYVSTNTDVKDFENQLIRGFLSFSTNFVSDYISEYEIKLLLGSFVSRDAILLTIFGSPSSKLSISGNSGVGNYLLSEMASIGLIGNEMVDTRMVVRKVHFNLQKYKPELNGRNRRSIHDQALSSGQLDDNRADYTKFFTKRSNSSSYFVDPLDTGRFTSSAYHRIALERRSATKIQSYVRLHFDRKIADQESQRVAFLEAKLAIVKQLKNRILKEYQQREATKGVSKMKWDAEVRVRQAKFRSQGQNLNRSETVMLLVEEAVTRAKAEIEQRFKQFEPPPKLETARKEKPVTMSVFDLYGLPKVFDDSISFNEFNPPQVNLNTDIDVDEEDGNHASIRTLTSLEVDYGRYFENQTSPGCLIHCAEDSVVRAFRRRLCSSEVDRTQHLFHRLHRTMPALTEFKTNEILKEFPSKRLLLRYLEHSDESLICDDLKLHFKIRNESHVRDSYHRLRSLVDHDVESGILRRRGQIVSKIFDEVLQSGNIRQLRQQYTSGRLTASSSIDDICTELTRWKSLQRDMNRRASVQLDNRIKSYMESQTISESVSNATMNIQSIEHQLDPEQFNFQNLQRFNWMWRLKNCRSLLKGPSDKSAIEELKSIVEDFSLHAKFAASIIISELFRSESEKSIPIICCQEVNGRTISGRGLHGKKYVFEAYNIYFHVALDYDGVFNGSHEYAAKNTGKERLGAELLDQLDISGLGVPLTATIDVFGFRVLATSKLPIVHGSFGDDGLVQGQFKDLLHGLKQDCSNFIFKSRKVMDVMKVIGTALNLKEHKCKGRLDAAPTKTFAAGLKIYRGLDNTLYVRNLSSLFVHELTNPQVPLCSTPRDQGIFWRFVRPELTAAHPVPLSVDAGSLPTYSMDDEQSSVADIHDAILQGQSRLMDLAEGLLARNYVLPMTVNDTINLSNEFHRMGLNVRHMGTLRSLLWRKLPGKVSIFHNENFFRTSTDIRLEFEEGESILSQNRIFVIKTSPRNKSTRNRIPIDADYRDQSVHKVDAWVGSTKNNNISSNENLRMLLLGEMCVRCIKHAIRLHLRQFCEQHRTLSVLFFRTVVCHYLNAITGSRGFAEELFQDVLPSMMTERFGIRCLRPSEVATLSSKASTMSIFMVRRLMDVLDFRINSSCLSKFECRSFGFCFQADDLSGFEPICRTSISEFPFFRAISAFHVAEAIALESYSSVVKNDNPLVFYTFLERRGSRRVSNKGSLGSDWAGALSDACLLELDGPISGEKFVKAVGFRSNTPAFVDIKYHEALVQSSYSHPFTVELFFRGVEGMVAQKTLLASGRLSIKLLRDNQVVVSLHQDFMTINIRSPIIANDNWNHLVVTFDGAYLRLFDNGIICNEVETVQSFVLKYKQFSMEHMENISKLRAEEDQEKNALKDKVAQESAQFFQSRDGSVTLKRMTQVILDLEENGDLVLVDENLTGTDRVRQRNAAALRKAKEKYIEENLQAQIRDVSIRYKQMLLDLEDQHAAKIRDGKLRSFEPFRLGAALPDSNNRLGSEYFNGDVSCFSVFDSCLPPDRVRLHYIAAIRNCREDAHRAYSFSISLFDRALESVHTLTTSMFSYLEFYSKALCYRLQFEPEERFAIETSSSTAKILNTIKLLSNWKKLEPIAQLINFIPRDQEFAEIIVAAVLAIKSIDKNFLSKTQVLQRSTLVSVPFDYSLISSNRPPSYFEAAAFIFQEVIRDINLMFSYGDIDLRWIGEIKSPKMVIALVKTSFEDKSTKFIRVADFFNTTVGDPSLLTDEDVQVLSQYLPLTEGFDFRNCISIGDESIRSLSRLGNIRVLVLDNCTTVTDKGFESLKSISSRLETLSMEQLLLVSDLAFAKTTRECSKLKSLNINKCPNLSLGSVVGVIQNNLHLESLGWSNCQLADEMLVRLAAELKKCRIISLDLSYCLSMTDTGLNALVDACGSLKSLNISNNSRLSTLSIRALCCKCWNLENLHLDEIFMVTDDIFCYSPTVDGRSACSDRMLSVMSTLSLKGCDFLSDSALCYLGERCRRITSFSLYGCKKITDRGLSSIADSLLCPSSSQSFCLTLKKLDLSFLPDISTGGVLSTLKECKNLEAFVGTGLVRVIDDVFLRHLGSLCPSIQHLGIGLCIAVTDVGICSISESLWMETIDISGCFKITDCGVQVLSSACTGLKSVNFSKLRFVSDTALDVVRKNCPDIDIIL